MRFSQVTNRFWLRRSKIEYEDDSREGPPFPAIVPKIVLVLVLELVLDLLFDFRPYGSSGFADCGSGTESCAGYCFLGFDFLCLLTGFLSDSWDCPVDSAL